MTAVAFKYLTWNTNGINNLSKRRKILNFLKNHKIDIALLQETHLNEAEHIRLTRQWQGQTFYSSFTSKSRGVATLIGKNVPLQIDDVVKDKQGRYLILKGILAGEPITLVNIYGPNYDSPQFFQSLFLTLTCHASELIIGGDLNLVLDPAKDRSSSSPKILSQAAKTLKKEMTDFKLIDAWREKHKTESEYSFYSHSHKSYSRIDIFLTHVDRFHLISSCEYLAMTYSDHAPLMLQMAQKNFTGSSRLWRFPTHLLNDVDYVKLVNEKIVSFISINKETASPTMVWESLKTYLRGETISYTSWKKKQYLLKTKTLESEIRNLEKEHSQTHSDMTFRLLDIKRTEYNLLTTRGIENAMARTKQQYYEHGDKNGKLLAWQIRKEENSRCIPLLKTRDNAAIIRDPKRINDTFKEFYVDLYSSQGVDPHKLHTFIEGLAVPGVDVGTRENLETDITKQEVLNAINKLSAGKSPGPDGFPMDFYKTFAPNLIMPLMDMFKHSLKIHQLPKTLVQALITVLLKPGKDPKLCGSYRPIALLSSDYKIFTKVIATRLERVIPDLIHKDQTGFIQNRFSSDNIRRLLNIICCADNINTPTVALSLDAEKAFDRLEWPYLFAVLEKMNFGPNLMQMIQMLYLNPSAMIRTNANISSLFPLSRGTRQGCPLSPLLFSLAIEPLAIAIRAHPIIEGVMVEDVKHIISLYADDIMLYLTNVDTSLPALCTLLEEYGCISGYKINKQKSVMMPLNPAAQGLSTGHIPFYWDPHKLCYLGLQIPNQLHHIYSLNYEPLLKKVEADLDRWKSLPISLIGRINCIKMNILPKFLYFFQALPTPIPKAFFKNLNRLLSTFLWNGKTPRVKLKTLCRPTEQGGLNLPDFQLYYLAAQSRAVWVWIKDLVHPPAWKQIEQSHTAEALSSIPFIHSYHKQKKVTLNPMIKHTSKIWDEIRIKFNNICKLYSSTPFHFNPVLPPALRDGITRDWFKRGVCTFGQLYEDSNLRSFEQLKLLFGLPSVHFYKYLQVRDFIRVQQGGKLIPLVDSEIDHMMRDKHNSKCFLSHTYHGLMSLTENKAFNAKLKWETDTDSTFRDSEWKDICSSSQSFSYNSRHKLLQFNLIHRVYLTPHRLHKISNKYSDCCPRCTTEIGTLFHMFWTCKCLEQYWRSILDIVKGIVGVEIPATPRLTLLGDLSVFPVDTRVINTRFIRLALIAANKCIAINWKSKDPPGVPLWLKELSSYLPSEKIMFNLKKKQSIFDNCWGGFITFLHNRASPMT